MIYLQIFHYIIGRKHYKQL